MASCKKDDIADKACFFSPATLKLFASPQSWKYVTPFQKSADIKPVKNADFTKWMSRNRHVHPFHEILVAVSGTALYGVGDFVFQCGPGTMLIIAPNQPHAGRYRLSDNNLNHIWISFITPEQAFIQFTAIQHGRIRWINDGRSLINVSGLSRLLQTLDTEKNDGTLVKETQTHLRLTAFFAELLNSIIETGSQAPDLIDRDLMLKKKINMICEHIRETGGVNQTLSDLASIAGYTPSHFARLFKQVTGHTVHQHIDSCRINTAKELLSRQIPLKSMADSLGFSDKTSMSRWLNKHRRALQ